jgi:CopG family transcriptional regulator, nickel-responsive regulator
LAKRRHHERVSRVSFSVQPRLLKEFDGVWRQMGYEERSKALQNAIRRTIGDHELSTNPETVVAGGILLLYDHSKREIDHDITEIGHDYTSVIASSTHVHLDKERCLDIATVRGRYGDVLGLEGALRKLDGVEQLKSTYFVIAT